MKENNNLKIYKTKNVSQTNLKKLKKLLSPQDYCLLQDFYTLTPQQRLYILETIKNIKKYHL